MVKTHDVIQYLKGGIEDNVVCNEECTYIDVEYSNETVNSFEATFTDYGTSTKDKTKYRITVESID